MKFRTLFLLALLASPTSTVAGGSVTDIYVKEIKIGNYGAFVRIVANTQFDNPDLCNPSADTPGSATTGQFVISKNDPLFEQQYAALLAALMAGGEVSLYFNGCSAGTYEGRPIAVRVSVHS